MNKRQHPRLKSHVEATLVTTNGSAHQCFIADFSQEGIRVFWVEGELVSLEIKDQVHIEITIDGELLNVPVLCLYVDATSAGFHLQNPSAKLFLSFQSINNDNKKNGSLLAEKRTFYKNIFKQKVMESTPAIIDSWHTQVLENLFNAATQAHDNDSQQNFFRAEKVIKENQKSIQQRFLSMLAEQLNCWLKHKPSIDTQENTQSSAHHDLSLIQEDEFEDWLLAKVTSTHLQSKLSHHSFEIRQLLDIVSEAKPEHRFNPISPVIITEAFRLAIKPLDLDKHVDRIVYQVFEKVAAVQLQQIFEALIKKIDIPHSMRTLHKPISQQPAVSESVTEESFQEEPQVIPAGSDNQSLTPAAASVKQTASRPEPKTSAPLTSQASSLASFRQNHESAERAYKKVQGLFSLRNQVTQQSEEQFFASENQPQAVMAEEFQVQSTLQNLWQSANTSQGRIRQDLEQALSSQDVTLPDEDREAIDTLEHVTQDLVSNKHVSDFIKPIIAELEQPLSMMMLNDPSMIFNPNHPGRLTLNSLSKLGLITTTGQNNVTEKLHSMMSNIDIASSPEDLLTQFRKLQQDVDSLLTEAERRVKMNADRVAQAAAGEHQFDQAREKVSRLISKDTSGKTLPAVVMEWLEQGWKPLLTLNLIREGVDSKRFRGAVKLYRQVLSLFNESNSGRSELLKRFEPLVELMRHELDKLNGPLAKHTLWHDELTEAAEQHLATGKIEQVVNVPAEAKVEKVNLEGKGVRKAQNLKVGDWLLLTEKDQSVSVVWIAEDSSKFACVNHSGMKVVDFTLEELSAALDDGSVKRIYEQPETAIDQSLDTLIQQIYSDLSSQANTDALTQVHTRSHFMRHLKEEVTCSQQSNITHTLCLIDIDQFKVINKEYGIEGGDKCLKSVAEQLLAFSDDALNCARMGSNEFAILLTESDIQSGEEKANKLLALLERIEVKSGKHTFRIRFSLGIAELNSEVSTEIELLQAAESACLSSKEKGGSRVSRYIENDQSRIKRDEFISWANKLNQALDSNQLKLLCLPLSSIQETKDENHQFEVIISIAGEDGCQTPPLEYLQATEHYSHMHLVDRWVLEQLTDWMKEQKEEMNHIESFILKLSGYFMNDEFLVSFLTEQIKDHGIPAHKLCFELHETSAIQNIEDATYFMHKVRELGCQFILSDFGSGKSSFEYLKRLPVDYVKIDQSFISDIMVSPADHAMVKSIHEIAQFMGKKTIAEKVHDTITFDILRNIGIDLAMETNLENALPFDQLMP